MKDVNLDQIKEPIKPSEHTYRHGGGQITKDKLGIYIATNPKILEDFNVDEKVHVISKDTIEHLYRQMEYYQKLNIYLLQTDYQNIRELTKKVQMLNKRNKQLQKTIIKLKEDIFLSAEN